jgi:hypothetical protein
MSRQRRRYLPKVGKSSRRSPSVNLPGYYLREPVERQQELLMRASGVRFLGAVITFFSLRYLMRRRKTR